MMLKLIDFRLGYRSIFSYCTGSSNILTKFLQVFDLNCIFSVAIFNIVNLMCVILPVLKNVLAVVTSMFANHFCVTNLIFSSLSLSVNILCMLFIFYCTVWGTYLESNNF